MTAVVGLVDGTRVYIGADSAGTSGYLQTIRRDPKVFRSGPYLIGFTSSFRMGQLLHHALVPPIPPVTGFERFMTTTFIDAVRDCLKEGGYATKESEAEQGGTFLVGVAGRLFEIGYDYQVGEPVSGYAACGCGEEIALGAMYATAGQPPKVRVRTALAAAEHFSAGVRGPFTVLSIGAGTT